MGAQYVVKDRTTAQNYALTVTDDVFDQQPTADPNSPEPIVEDDTNPGTYWKLFMDDGVFDWEQTVTVQDDVVDLVDSVTGLHHKLSVSDSVFDWPTYTPAASGADIFHFMRRGTHEGLLVGIR
jgi:hypothetical protein